MNGTELLYKTEALVAISSVSGNEQAIADYVEAELQQIEGLRVQRIGDNVIATSPQKAGERILLGGHLDTVPPSADQRTHVANGVLFGRGAADMKGGIAIMLALAARHQDLSANITWCFYANEEIARQNSGLLEIEANDASILKADFAILGEPTGGIVEAGCQGTLRIKITLKGKASHTARPFAGKNAVHRLAPLLDAVVGYEPEVVTVDGCEYAEQLQVVEINGGTGANVLPDSASIRVNYRFAPTKTSQMALDHVTELVQPFLDEAWSDELIVEDDAPGALPMLSNQHVAQLLAATKKPPVAKVGWTDVAFFQARGVPAVNFGPGDPLLAHRPTEQVTGETLGSCFDLLYGLFRTQR